MQSRGAFFIWLIVIIAVGVVVWWSGLFNKTRDLALRFGPSTFEFTSGLGDVKNAPSVKEKVKKILDKVASVPLQIASVVGQTVKNALVESAKEEVGVAIDAAQQKLGLGISGVVNEQPLAIAIRGARSRPLGFLIDGRDGNGSYAIDWGDDEKSTGNVAANEKKIVEHSWPQAGSYLVIALLTTTKTGATRLFSFPVVIE